MGIFQNNLMGAAAAAASAGGGIYPYVITNSIRFNGTDQALEKTWGSAASDDDKKAISVWIKRSGASNTNSAIGSTTNTKICSASDFNILEINTNNPTGYSDQFQYFHTGGARGNFLRAKWRDPSAWMHIIWIYNSDESTTTDRIKVYINGVNQPIGDTTIWDADGKTTYPDSGVDTTFGKNGNEMHIARYQYNDAGWWGGQMADFIMIDGAASYTDFGEFHNGIWRPVDPSGLTFGNNGFWLDFKSPSDPGNDASGNNNDFSVIGTIPTHDILGDSPTFDSDSNGGNFATWNPLNAGSYTTLVEGNLKATGTGSGASNPSGTFAMTSGKWYWEMLIEDEVSSYPYTGLTVLGNIANAPTSGGDIWAMRYDIGSGAVQANGTAANISGLGTITTVTTGVATATDGDIISYYLDCDNRKAWIAKNGTIPNSGDPADGTNPQWSWTTTPNNPITFTAQVYNGDDTILNAGQDGTFAGEKTAQGNSDDTGYGNFYYDPPTGFLAMCSGNQPVADEVDPAQTDDNFPQQLFNAQLWTGNGSSGRAITISGAKKPSLSVIKQRNSSNGWNVWTQGYNSGDYDSFGEFNSTGAWNANQGSSGPYTADPTASALTLTAYGQVNSNTNTYVNHRWIANGGTTSTNTTGATNSVTEADPSGCFSVVSYTGTGSGTTLGHSLSAAPKMIIVKRTDSSGDWWVYQQFMSASPQTSYMKLSKAEALATGDGGIAWNSTAPTSSVFSIGNTNDINASSGTFVAFCFANCEGYIKSGAYEGNGNADGAFIYTGFKPAWILYKSTTAQSWVVIDNARNTFNVAAKGMFTEANNAESDSTVTYGLDILSNGFKMRGTNNASNGSNTYIYLAMAKNPFKYATAR